MKNIEVPYMPVSTFNTLEYSEKFSESPGDSETDNLLPFVDSDDEEDLEDIALILTGLGMDKYIEVFKQEQVELDTFLQLTDADLQILGITDPKDREIITSNLRIHQSEKKDCVVPENQLEDIQILNNVFTHLFIMQKYSAYIQLQMRKHKLVDYKINADETAGTYLKAFAESSLIQARKLKKTIHDEENLESLINKILTINNLTLPSSLDLSLKKMQLKSNNRKQNTSATKIIIAVCSISVLLIGRYCLKKLYSSLFSVSTM